MRGIALARRYAHALFEQAQEEGVLERVTAELGGTVRILQSTELLPFLLSPRIPVESKERVIDRVTEEACSLLRRFLKLLLHRGRIRDLPETWRVLLRMEDQARGVQRGTVTTAFPLNDAQMERLRAELKRLMQKEVILETKVKPKIVSGAIVEIGDYLIDGSVERQIRDLRDRLRHARVNLPEASTR